MKPAGPWQTLLCGEIHSGNTMGTILSFSFLLCSAEPYSVLPIYCSLFLTEPYCLTPVCLSLFLLASEKDPKADEMTAATLPESGRPSGFITHTPPSVGYANKVWDGGFQM